MRVWMTHLLEVYMLLSLLTKVQDIQFRMSLHPQSAGSVPLRHNRHYCVLEHRVYLSPCRDQTGISRDLQGPMGAHTVTMQY